jgi:CDP-glycerol glycerophosphotransferase (TagB/SpsB family)
LKVIFYVEYPYYFPHFLPIGTYFTVQNVDVLYVLSEKQNSANMEAIAKENNIKYTFDNMLLYEETVDVIFFANPYENIQQITAMTLFLEHGIGTKSTSFFSFIEEVDIYLVEGMQKYNHLATLYPTYKDKLSLVGFSKFDEIVHYSKEKKKILYEKYNMDEKKKIILYAPTFFPSSIERMADDFPQQFLEYNIIIKPHYLSYERKKYKRQIEKFKLWEKYPHCTVLPLAEYNLVPWLAIADVMISDESSAMFEFAALNKPVISNQYFKLRWSYYLMPWKLNKRIDASKAKFREILDNAYSYAEMIKYVKEALRNPEKLASKRVKFSEALAGKIDGKVSERIYGVVMKKYKGSK